MALRIRGFAWEKTAIGAVEEWPETLLTSVNMMLSTRHPVLLMWGPEMVLLYNDAFRPILTNRDEDALGARGRAFWADVWPVVGEQLEAVLREGKDTFFENALVPLLRNGVLEDAWFSYSYSPVFDGTGHVAGIITICQDETATVVAERRRVEAQEKLDRTMRALHAERARLLDAFQQAPVFFALLEGPEHVFAMTNSLYLKVVAGRDVLGRSVAEAIPEAVDQGYVRWLDQVFRTGEPMSQLGARFEIVVTEGMGPEQRILDFVYQPMREEDGHIWGILVVGVDQTEKKQAEKALLQSEKLAAVGRMAASIAHEINNPLASVTNLLYLAKRSESLPEVQEFLETAEQELRRMTAITSQTLSFNKQTTRQRAVTCEELFSSVLHVYQSRIHNSGIAVKRQMRSEQPVQCFDGEIRQVLNNLVSNAIDAMPNGGQLVLRCRSGRNWKSGAAGVVLTVADTGTGMTAEVRKRIFEPFFTTKGMGGTGLGLWVSSGIVARHQGRLAIRSSQREGRAGTVFSLFLPVSSQ
jgi:signal transduction histidine kinase